MSSGYSEMTQEDTHTEGSNFAFSPDARFEAALRDRLIKLAEGELSEVEMVGLSAALGEDVIEVCPRWKNDKGEGYLRCLNCTDSSCLERTI